MANFLKTREYLSNKVLPCVRKRVPEACMFSRRIENTNLLEVQFYTKMPEVFGQMEIPFFSSGRQQIVENLVSAMVRKNPELKVTPILSGFLIHCD